jgi:hypothetical protein
MHDTLSQLLRRPGCENTHNLGVQMRRTFNRFFNQYKSLVEPNYPEMKFSREELLWGFNPLVACGWGSGNDGTGDKMMVPFSELPVHRRESAQKVIAAPFLPSRVILLTQPNRLRTEASSQLPRNIRPAKSSPLTTVCSTTLSWRSMVRTPSSISFAPLTGSRNFSCVLAQAFPPPTVAASGGDQLMADPLGNTRIACVLAARPYCLINECVALVVSLLVVNLNVCIPCMATSARSQRHKAKPGR